MINYHFTKTPTNHRLIRITDTIVEQHEAVDINTEHCTNTQYWSKLTSTAQPVAQPAGVAEDTGTVLFP